MRGYEFKELAGLVLCARGAPTGQSYPCGELCFKDDVVLIRGIPNLKILAVNKFLPRVGAVIKSFAVYESVGKRIKFYRHDDALVNHLMTLTVLEQLARL